MVPAAERGDWCRRGHMIGEQLEEDEEEEEIMSPRRGDYVPSVQRAGSFWERCGLGSGKEWIECRSSVWEDMK